MCGIAGILGNSDLVQEATLRKLAESLMHRGPDSGGTEIVKVKRKQDCHLGLVHRRLSIIDLSNAAHQPMQDKNTGNRIVYNGEIYNYQEHKEELIGRGNIFNSNSDTEVILKSYAVYAENCLEKLRGMFAFAIWDEERERLFLATDRFGIKPLYFCEKPNGEFIFSSEIKAILRNGLVGKELEPLAIDSFLAYGSVQAPLTIIRGVHILLPGHYLIYDVQQKESKIVQYWSPRNSTASVSKFNESQKISQFRVALEGSIKAHLTSDVPVGLFLSGGVDSSALAILSNKVSNGDGLESFSIVFSENDYSERKYSRLIGEKFCSRHNEIHLSETDLYDSLPQALGAMDQPSVDGINTYIISRAVRERGIKTVLSGQGGDEIFGGYSSFKRIALFQKLFRLIAFLPASFNAGMGKITEKMCGGSISISKINQVLQSKGDPFSQYMILRQLYSPEIRRNILRNICNEVAIDGLTVKTKEWLAGEIKHLDLFTIVSILEMRLYLANTLLRDGDVMSMAHGLEIRVPFIDHELLKHVFDMPIDMKVDRKIPKPLLVEAVYNELPREIYMRPKMGFTFPWEVWLRNKLRYQVDDLLGSYSENNGMGLNIAECRRQWNLFIQKNPQVSWSRVWAIYVLLHWYNENILAA